MSSSGLKLRVLGCVATSRLGCRAVELAGVAFRFRV